MSDESTGPDQNPPPPGGSYPPPGSSYPSQGGYPPQYGGNQPPNWGSAYPSPGAYPQGAYPQGGYPQGYGQPYPAIPPKHPQAITAMVLGIVSLAGLVTCLVPILVAPFAWIVGAKSVRAIDANPAAYSGRNEANAGKIMGIVGTVILILIILGLSALVAVGISSESSYD